MHAHLVFAAAAASLFVGLLVYLRQLKPSIVRVQLSFSESQFRGVLANWSPQSLHRFRTHFAFDYLFIILYAVAGWLFGQTATAGPHPPGWAHVAQWSLPFAAALDALENLLHQRFLAHAPGALPGWQFTLAGVSAAGKFALWGAFCLALTRL